jgi:hypothetical protein
MLAVSIPTMATAFALFPNETPLYSRRKSVASSCVAEAAARRRAVLRCFIGEVFVAFMGMRGNSFPAEMSYLSYKKSF